MKYVRSYYVDGTNLVRILWGYGGPEFRQQEERDRVTLVESLAVLCGILGGRAEIEVFFDGDGRRWKGIERMPPNMRVRFAQEDTADSLILDRVRAGAFAGAGSVTVVTADGDLGRRAQQEGGRWMRVRPEGGLEPILAALERRS